MNEMQRDQNDQYGFSQVMWLVYSYLNADLIFFCRESEGRVYRDRPA